MNDDGVINIKCAYPGCDERYVGLFGWKDCVPFCTDPKHKKWARHESSRREKVTEK
jgi:hypothetical protein